MTARDGRNTDTGTGQDRRIQTTACERPYEILCAVFSVFLLERSLHRMDEKREKTGKL